MLRVCIAFNTKRQAQSFIISCLVVSASDIPLRTITLLWAPAQRKRATMLYFANVILFIFFMAALFSGPG